MKELGLRMIVTLAAFSAVLSVTSCSTARMAYRPYDKEYIPLGFLVKDTYRSSVPGPGVRYMFVYLPESYFDSGLEYPVVYMLHGANGRTTASCSLKNCGKTFLEEGSDRCCDGVLLLTQEMILVLDQLQGAARIYLMILLGI